MSQWIYGTSRALAWLGGVVLLALSFMIVASIIGRTFSNMGLGPIQGDFELVETGTAVAVFCCMPWAHLTRSHAVVDLFWNAYPPTMQKILIILGDALMLLLWTLLIWRMGAGLQAYRNNAEVSFILQWPVWWGYAACLLPGIFGCLVYLWRLLEDMGVVSAPASAMAGKGI